MRLGSYTFTVMKNIRRMLRRCDIPTKHRSSCYKDCIIDASELLYTACRLLGPLPEKATITLTSLY